MMNQRKTLVAVLFFLAPVMAFAQEATKQEDSEWKDLNATWQPVKMQMAGNDFPSEQIQSIKLTLKDGEYTMKMIGGVEESGKVELGEGDDDKPAAMDISIEEGQNKGKTIKAIFKIEEEKLIVCYAMTGDRPTEFESTKDNGYLFLEYEKVKK